MALRSVANKSRNHDGGSQLAEERGRISLFLPLMFLTCGGFDFSTK